MPVQRGPAFQQVRRSGRYTELDANGTRSASFEKFTSRAKGLDLNW
jgi:hypothetical protein